MTGNRRKRIKQTVKNEIGQCIFIIFNLCFRYAGIFRMAKHSIHLFLSILCQERKNAKYFNSNKQPFSWDRNSSARPTNNLPIDRMNKNKNNKKNEEKYKPFLNVFLALIMVSLSMLTKRKIYSNFPTGLQKYFRFSLSNIY